VSDSDDDFEARLARKSAPTAFNSADPPRNFSLSVNDRIRAMTIGAPAYATRKKSIEDREERFVAVLVALHDTLVAKRARAGHAHDPDLAMKAMLDRAATFDLARLNALIATHNRYYPIEANLDFAHSSSSSLATLGPATLIIEGLGSAWAPELDDGPPAQNSLLAASMMAFSSLATSMAPISSSP
jgi:hypothetical protein